MSLSTVYQCLFLSELQLWLGWGGNQLEKGVREGGAGARVLGLWENSCLSGFF